MNKYFISEVNHRPDIPIVTCSLVKNGEYYVIRFPASKCFSAMKAATEKQGLLFSQRMAFRRFLEDVIKKL